MKKEKEDFLFLIICKKEHFFLFKYKSSNLKNLFYCLINLAVEEKQIGLQEAFDIIKEISEKFKKTNPCDIALKL